MAQEDKGKQITLEASADLSTHQHKFVVVDASGQAALAGANVDVVGVLQNKPAAAGRAAEIMVSGISKVIAGAAVTQGSRVRSDASGLAIDAAATFKAVGFALDAAAGANEVIRVLLKDLGTF